MGLEDLAEGVLGLFGLFSWPVKSKLTFSEKIDQTIERWAPRYGLEPVYGYKDAKVRSIIVKDDTGGTYTIWIESLRYGRVKVTAGNTKKYLKKKSWKRKSKLNGLEPSLDLAYAKIYEWILRRGSTRSYETTDEQLPDL